MADPLGFMRRQHAIGPVTERRMMGPTWTLLTGPDAGEAVVAAGDLLPLEGDAPHQHGEGERQHGEVDLRQPHAEVADDRGHQPGQHHRRRQRAAASGQP